MEPIKDFETIKDIADYLKCNSKLHGERNRMLWMMGVYFGLRVSKLLELKVRDVRGKDIVHLRENKRNKERKLVINADLKPVLDEYIKDKADYEYLFASQKKNGQPITRQRAYEIIKDAGRAFGHENIGAHTLRKTYGYIIYIQSGKDPVAVKEALNVGSTHTALRYIGIIKDQSTQLINNIKLFS